MTTDLILGFIVIVACLTLSAFFSATETALISLSSLKTKHLRENSGPLGHVLDLWLHSPHKVLIAVLVGNNLVNIFAAVYADKLVLHVAGQSHLMLVTVVMTVVIVLFSEIVPKSFAKTHATSLAIPLLNVFRIFYWALYPFTSFASNLTQIATSALGPKDAKASPPITEEELEFFINVGEEEGVLPEQKHEMLSGIFELGDTVVREIMVHRIDMTALSANVKVIDAVDIYRDTGLSRIPIYEDRIDNVVGIVHAKDVLFFLKKHRDEPLRLDTPLSEIKREAMFVPESKPVDMLFQELRRQRQHMAIVLDEYGGTSGLVTMEDIFEEIVGEVRDEFDNEEDAIRPTQVANQYLVECKIHIDDFCDFFDLKPEDIVERDQTNEFDTLGGFVIHHFGQIPRLGDRLNIKRVTIEIIEVSKRRVRRVLAKVNDTALEPNKDDEKSLSP